MLYSSGPTTTPTMSVSAAASAREVQAVASKMRAREMSDMAV